MVKKTQKIEARLPRGFVDITAEHINKTDRLIKKISRIYELYGFTPLELPMVEYTEVLGKFLPDEDRPNEGVFSLQDEDGQWLSLRYDLTAPLARYVAEHYDRLIKPYRSYRCGYVFRNEKAGPGRFRQFLQCDADVVAAPTITTDAELCMMAADIMQEVGLRAGQYVVRVNNRKLLEAVLQLAGLQGSSHAHTRLQVLRAIDKLDKFGIEGVALLLGKGRLDESGDFTKGAGLDEDAQERILAFVQAGREHTKDTLEALREIVNNCPIGLEGVMELEQMWQLITKSGYEDSIKIDPSVVRGLSYYTGPVFEVELLFDVKNKKGQNVVFGSVGGGGRYDGLVSLFREEPVACSGLSIGISRLLTALDSLQQYPEQEGTGPVLILVMDKDTQALSRYQAMAQLLRQSGIAAEVYAGSAGIKAQMKYADRRFSPCVIIQGERERVDNKVQIKDLIEGKKIAQDIEDNTQWRMNNPSQVTIEEKDLLQTIQNILQRHAHAV